MVEPTSNIYANFNLNPAAGGLSLKSFEVPPYLKLRRKIFGKESENVEHSGWGE